MRSLDGNARRYPLYAGLFNAFFWMPIFFLYFSEHLTLGQVLVLEAIYYAAAVILEVPSGYFSDTVGRRPTLLVSSLSLTASYTLFLIGDGFATFAAAQVLLAGGIAFNSGTDVSFHYDSLAAADRADEFDDREAHVSRIGFLAMSGAAVAGGAIAMLDLRLAYGLSLGAALVSVIVVMTFQEPPETEPRTGRRNPAAQLWRCLAYTRRPVLGWLFALNVAMVVLNHLPYEFYQPYTRLLDLRTLGAGDSTPLVTGLHAAAVAIVASWIAGRSIWIRNRIGLAPTMLLAVALQTAILLGMGLTLHPALLLLVLLRSVPRGLTTAPMNAAVAPRVGKRHRATYFSIQSLGGRLVFAAVLAGLGRLSGGADDPTWDVLSTLLLTSAGIGGALLLGLGLTARAVRAE